MRRAVYQYFLELGYPAADLTLEAAIAGGERIDLLVRRGDEPWVVVEVAQSDQMWEMESADALRFDPHVRSLQTRATQVGASFYVLSTTRGHTWFATDLTGRPVRLDAPVRHGAVDPAVDFPPDRFRLARLLRSTRDYLREFGARSPEQDTALVVAAKLTADRGNQWLLHELGIDPHGFLDGWHKGHDPFDESGRPVDSRLLTRAFSGMRGLLLSEVRPIDLLSAVDDALLSGMERRSDFRIPRWVADLIVGLAQVGPGDVVLDPACGFGDLLVATNLIAGAAGVKEAWGFTNSPYQAFWARVRQVLLGYPPENVQRVDALAHPAGADVGRPTVPPPTHIVVAPEFGLRLKSHAYEYAPELGSRRSVRSEEAHLAAAFRRIRPGGRVVILVPEGLLFNEGSRAVREWMLRRACLRAVIGLEAGSLLPYLSIKVSALVLDERSGGEERPTFVAQLGSPSDRSTRGEQGPPDAARVVEEFRRWMDNWAPPTHVNTTVIDRPDLDPADLTAQHYLARREAGNLEPDRYPRVRLGDLATLIKRGSPLRLDESGDVRVIGPAAIRPLRLDAARLERTRSSGVPRNALIARAGDVVMNNIGKYVGAAAVVEQDAEGAHVAQHVILVRTDEARILQDYLAVSLNSREVRSQVDRMAMGTVIPALSVARLADLMIPLPDLPTQRALARSAVEARQALQQAQAALDRAEEVLTSMLSKIGQDPGPAAR